MAIDKATLSRLRRRIAALEGPALGDTGHNVISFGLAAVDAHLPGGGLASGGVHEITDGTGTADGGNGSVTAFAAALAGRAQRLHRHPVVWIAPRIAQRESLYAPGLAAFGLDPSAVVVVRAPSHGRHGATPALWAMEDALRSPAVGTVCAEIDAVDLTASRRLQLAAEAGGVTAIALRPPQSRLAPTAAATRWLVAPAPSRPTEGYAGVGAPRWRVDLQRCRGGRPRHWLMEWDDASGAVAVVAALADRPVEPGLAATG